MTWLLEHTDFDMNDPVGLENRTSVFRINFEIWNDYVDIGNKISGHTVK